MIDTAMKVKYSVKLIILILVISILLGIVLSLRLAFNLESHLMGNSRYTTGIISLTFIREFSPLLVIIVFLFSRFYPNKEYKLKNFFRILMILFPIFYTASVVSTLIGAISVMNLRFEQDISISFEMIHAFNKWYDFFFGLLKVLIFTFVLFFLNYSRLDIIRYFTNRVVFKILSLLFIVSTNFLLNYFYIDIIINSIET